jgi:hypothetical protein
MIREIPSRALLACLFTCIAVAACQQRGSRGDNDDSTAQTSSTGVPERPVESPLAPRGPSESPGKPLPPIEFGYRILGTPALGQPLEIEISSRVQSALAGLNVALSGGERLQVPVEMARMRLANAAGGERVTETIRVTPLTEGTLYLNVLLQAEIDGRLQSRAVTIPIRVGGPAVVAPAGTLSTDANGEPIISLPASEN